MTYLIRNASVFKDGGFIRSDVFIRDGVITDLKSGIPSVSADTVFDMNNCFVFPGLIDVHVHLREPGFSYKETIGSGSRAAARGGFTTVCAMPNLDPVPDKPEHIKRELEIIKRDGAVRVLPYASITVGEKQRELSDMEGLAPYAVAFSDDGVGVENAELMELAMQKAKGLGKIIAAHCEYREMTNGGAVHAGIYAKKHGLVGNPSESEWKAVKRDLELVKKTGCEYHVCHVSTKESVELIRKAKAEGLPVTCETAPHYLTLCDEELRDDGSFKMNPPLRGREDRAALIEGIADGTIDMIATDHAPHSREEKSGGLAKSLNGIVGLETAFPVLYTKLVLSGIITPEKLIELMHTNPAKRFNIDGGIKVGGRADIAVFDLDGEYVIDPHDFMSKGRATPFAGEKVHGKCLLTFSGGEPAWIDGSIKAGK